MGAVRRLYRGAAVILAVIVVAFVVQKVLGGRTVTPHLVSSRPVALIGSGDEALVVADDGSVLTWLSAEGLELPQLPLESPPKSGRLQGPGLEQVQVLAATPKALLPYVAASSIGESG